MFGYRIQLWGEAPVWEEIAKTPPGTGDLVVEVEACGVGRTVLNSQGVVS